MDADRRESGRAFAESPGDQALARRHVAALVRGGHRHEALALYEAKYLCPASWDLGHGGVRGCTTCGADVAVATDERDAIAYLRQGRAAAIPVGARSLVFETLLEDSAFHVAREQGVHKLHAYAERFAAREGPDRDAFHSLLREIERHEGDALAEVVLEPWIVPARRIVFVHSAFRRRSWTEDPGLGARRDDLWELYALLRVSDLLLGRAIRSDGFDLSDYVSFFEAIGLTRLESERPFSPPHHEIVAVEEQAKPFVELTGERWPGLALGELIFTRAGVAIRAPRALVDPEVAVGSRLFFSHRRESRPCEDLSTGWGHNSQWRTGLPRFYDERGLLLLNVDGERELGPGWQPSEDDKAPLERKREVLLHRSSVRAPAVVEDDAGWALHERMAVRDDGQTSLWPLDPELVEPLAKSSLA